MGSYLSRDACIAAPSTSQASAFGGYAASVYAAGVRWLPSSYRSQIASPCIQADAVVIEPAGDGVEPVVEYHASVATAAPEVHARKRHHHKSSEEERRKKKRQHGVYSVKAPSRAGTSTTSASALASDESAIDRRIAELSAQLTSSGGGGEHVLVTSA